MKRIELSLIKEDWLNFVKPKKINYWIHILGLSTLLSVFPANKVLSGYPSLRPITAKLDLSYDECKTRVNEVTNLVFSEVQSLPEENGYFQLFGLTTRTVSTLICVESEQGSYFIFSVSGGYADVDDEDESIYQRISQYMIGS